MPDEGQPIAYEVLEPNVPVYSSQGEQVGTVDHVVAAPELDIFHGIVMRTAGRRVFIAAELVGALHEHGCDLKIDTQAVAALPDAEPEPEARPLHEPSAWRRFVDGIRG